MAIVGSYWNVALPPAPSPPSVKKQPAVVAAWRHEVPTGPEPLASTSCHAPLVPHTCAWAGAASDAAMDAVTTTTGPKRETIDGAMLTLGGKLQQRMRTMVAHCEQA
jgi:hypothetical protein